MWVGLGSKPVCQIVTLPDYVCLHCLTSQPCLYHTSPDSRTYPEVAFRTTPLAIFFILIIKMDYQLLWPVTCDIHHTRQFTDYFTLYDYDPNDPNLIASRDQVARDITIDYVEDLRPVCMQNTKIWNTYMKYFVSGNMLWLCTSCQWDIISGDCYLSNLIMIPPRQSCRPTWNTWMTPSKPVWLIKLIGRTVKW